MNVLLKDFSKTIHCLTSNHLKNSAKSVFRNLSYIFFLFYVYIIEHKPIILY